LLIRKRIHAGHVYLGREVMKVLGVKDGDEVELEVRGNEVIVRPVKTIDKNTLDLIRMLKEVKAYGGYEDYFEEYNYEDVGG